MTAVLLRQDVFGQVFGERGVGVEPPLAAQQRTEARGERLGRAREVEKRVRASGCLPAFTPVSESCSGFLSAWDW